MTERIPTAQECLADIKHTYRVRAAVSIVCLAILGASISICMILLVLQHVLYSVAVCGCLGVLYLTLKTKRSEPSDQLETDQPFPWNNPDEKLGRFTAGEVGRLITDLSGKLNLRLPEVYLEDDFNPNGFASMTRHLI